VASLFMDPPPPKQEPAPRRSAPAPANPKSPVNTPPGALPTRQRQLKYKAGCVGVLLRGAPAHVFENGWRYFLALLGFGPRLSVPRGVSQ
jgi:hypothetical protein